MERTQHPIDEVRTRLSLDNFRALLKDPLYRNSLFIMLSSATSAVIGLVFWIVAAQYYSTDSIGVAAALISTSSLLATIGALGMDQSMIRYFPTHDRSRVYGTALKMSVLFCAVIGVVFTLGSSLWMPDLVTSGANGLLFVLLICATSIASMTQTAFAGERIAKYSWVQNLLVGTRVLLLIPLVTLGSLGIVLAVLLAYAIAFPVSGVNLRQSGIRMGRIDVAYLKETLWFSSGSYLGTIFANIPFLTMALLAFNLLGAYQTAIYYMALSIASILFIIPNATATSLFVEGSHGEGIGRIVRKTFLVTYALLIPLILAFAFTGEWVLGIVGYEYASQGLNVLNLLVASSLLVAVFQVEITVLKIQGRIRGVVTMGVVNSLFFFALSYFLVHLSGMEGICYAWIGSYAVASVVGYLYIRTDADRAG